ncbi:MAG: hypothetical protein V3R41_06725, partial [Gammaproteobacteria bacterium]
MARAPNTGTAISTTPWIRSGTSTTYQIGFNSILISKPENLFKPKVKVRDLPKKGFWDGVEWKAYNAYFPRKSITGKWIVGKIHKRWRTPPIEHRGVGLGNHKQYATTK